eukprot:scaffold305226_cov35-Tisochrysis_lutea.AAC.1
MRVVLSSTGLSSSERRALESAVRNLPEVTYSGNLTSETTHLVALDRTASSAKLVCADARRLHVVLPSWIIDSSANGALLPLTKAYIVERSSNMSGAPPSPSICVAPESMPGHNDPQPSHFTTHAPPPVETPQSPLLERQQNMAIEPLKAAPQVEAVLYKGTHHPTGSKSMDFPGDSSKNPETTQRPSQILDLLRSARERGHLDDAMLSDTVRVAEDAEIAISGHFHLLEGLTDFRRSAGLCLEGGFDMHGDPYSLRSILLCLLCRNLSHADYCMLCLRWVPYTPPILVQDKAALLEAVGVEQLDFTVRLDHAREKSADVLGLLGSMGKPSAETNDLEAPHDLNTGIARTPGHPSEAEMKLRLQVDKLERLLQFEREQQKLRLA